MNPVLIATAYIYDLLEDPNIELIEVWANVLYARMRKGCGRNKFISKHNLTFHLPVYYNESSYKPISKRYHPDVQRRASKGKKGKQSSIEQLQQHINVSRPALSELFTGRRSSGISYTRSHACFTKLKSSKPGKKSDMLVEQLGEQLSKAGYSDAELFGLYIDSPLDSSVGEDLRAIDSEEEILQAVREAFASEIREAEREGGFRWEQICKAKAALGL